MFMVLGSLTNHKALITTTPRRATRNRNNVIGCCHIIDTELGLLEPGMGYMRPLAGARLGT
jgi:hypothetical protein